MQLRADINSTALFKPEIADRGDGFLRRKIGHIHELESRRRTALRDWIAATLAVASQQFAAFGLDLSTGWFALMVVLSSTAIAVSWVVYPRLSLPRFLAVEQAMMILAWGTIAVLVCASGGSNSPYIFFYAQTMFYVAYFMDSTRLTIAHIAIGSLCAIAPIVYDYNAAIHNNFVPTIVIALAVWWAMCVVVAFKHRAALRVESQARRLSLTDPLTGTANVRGIENLLAEQNGKPFALAMVDLKGLSKINARFGYFVGDEIIRRAAATLRAASGPEDQVGRVGGDEFVVIIPGGSKRGADQWRHRFSERITLENARSIGGARLAASVGTAVGPSDGKLLADLITVADREIASQKRRGSPEPEERTAPKARAERLTARIATPKVARSRFNLKNLKAPAGPRVAIAAAVATGAIIHLTGGSTSVLLSVVLAVTAYFAYFGTLREAVFGVTATLTGFAVAVFGWGSTGPVEQTRFSTIVFGAVVIAYALQSNGQKLALAELQAEELSLTDALTGLPNRRAFDQDFSAAIEAVGENVPETAAGQPGLVLIDLENFRDVNAALGHTGGDQLLCEVSYTLRAAVGDDGIVYRIGGDQFAVTCLAHHVHRVETIAQRCYEAIRDIDADGHYIAQMVAIGAIVGFSHWMPGATSADLIGHAVKRMSDPELPLRIAGTSPSIAS